MVIKTIHNLMLPNYLKIVKEIGSKNSKTRARAGGANTTPFFLRRILLSKVRNSGAAKARVGWVFFLVSKS